MSLQIFMCVEGDWITVDKQGIHLLMSLVAECVVRVWRSVGCVAQEGGPRRVHLSSQILSSPLAFWLPQDEQCSSTHSPQPATSDGGLIGQQDEHLCFKMCVSCTYSHNEKAAETIFKTEELNKPSTLIKTLKN